MLTDGTLRKSKYSNCLPKLTYGAAVKDPSSNEKQQYNVAVNDAVRRIFGFRWWDSTPSKLHHFCRLCKLDPLKWCFVDIWSRINQPKLLWDVIACKSNVREGLLHLKWMSQNLNIFAQAQTNLLSIIPMFNSPLQMTNRENIEKVQTRGKACLKSSNINPFWFVLRCHPPRGAHHPSVTLGAYLRAPKQPEILVR